MFYNCLLLRQKPRVWGPWKRITTWNASSQLLKFSNLAQIGQIGRQRDKLMQNLLRLLADGVDASSPNKSNVIKWRLYFKSNLMTNLMLQGVLTAPWCWSRVWRERSAGRSSPSFSATSNSQRWYYEDGELNHLLIKDQIFCQNWGWSRYGQLTCRQLWLNFFWTYCTFLPHHTSLLPQVLHKKANCSRELKCISSVAHFRPLTFSTRQGRSVI